MEIISKDLVQGYNSLTITFAVVSQINKGIYRCMDNNGLGIVVDSETHLSVKGKNRTRYNKVYNNLLQRVCHKMAIIL